MPATKSHPPFVEIPECYAASDITSVGIVLGITPSCRTSNGRPSSAGVPTWEQLQLLRAQTQRLNTCRLVRPETTGSRFAIIPIIAECGSADPQSQETPEFPTYEKQIAIIRSALSLQMKELAQAVGVERPTVYSWINNHNAPQAANRQRLHAVYRLAQRWNRMSSTPLGKALHRVDSEGRSVFDLMCEDSIQTSTILERLRAISQSSESALRPNPTSVRELARKHNVNLSRVAERQDDNDLETGKRIDAE